MPTRTPLEGDSPGADRCDLPVLDRPAQAPDDPGQAGHGHTERDHVEGGEQDAAECRSGGAAEPLDVKQRVRGRPDDEQGQEYDAGGERKFAQEVT